MSKYDHMDPEADENAAYSSNESSQRNDVKSFERESKKEYFNEIPQNVEEEEKVEVIDLDERDHPVQNERDEHEEPEIEFLQVEEVPEVLDEDAEWVRFCTNLMNVQDRVERELLRRVARGPS